MCICFYYSFIYFFHYTIIWFMCKFFVHFLLGALMSSKKMPLFLFHRLGREMW